ncbi:hypothetical protein Cch01nite_12670 [Cellulomonas chitinilytica]|uniref:Uncharacterized protein n=2 Tax=Cellulomonas chitinilytica TaxID=398759 RepID=A0A919TZ69_9CELL|nr:hypothetical protein Cch01nite_12670 [Cellulomonas chitinilytica]
MIDCDSCSVRGAACTDCVVTFLTVTVRPGALAPAPRVRAGVVELDTAERHALGVLAAQGLVPPLRLEPAG